MAMAPAVHSPVKSTLHIRTSCLNLPISAPPAYEAQMPHLIKNANHAFMGPLHCRQLRMLLALMHFDIKAI